MQGTDPSNTRQAKPLWRSPDLITALRLPLAAAFVYFPDAAIRLAVLVVAAATDYFDGILARRVGGSRAGAVLDPVVDKLFMAAAFIVVLTADVLHPIEVVAILLRDIVALLAFITTVVLGRPAALPARAGGKAVTVLQLLTLLAFLAESDLLRPLAWATAAISVYAIADYMRVGLKPREEG